MSLKIHEHRGDYWRKKLKRTIFKEQLQCREIRLKVKKVIIKASFHYYNNSDVIATLIITNFHLYLILTAVVVIFPNRC